MEREPDAWESGPPKRRRLESYHSQPASGYIPARIGQPDPPEDEFSSFGNCSFGDGPGFNPHLDPNDIMTDSGASWQPITRVSGRYSPSDLMSQSIGLSAGLPDPVQVDLNRGSPQVNCQSHPSSSSQDHGDETVCFGMIAGLSATIKKHEGLLYNTDIPFYLTSSNTFQLEGDCQLVGDVDEHSQQSVAMLKILLDSPQVQLEGHCIVEHKTPSTTHNRKHIQGQICSCVLSLNVYGPLDLFEEIGTFFEKWEVHLQDPRNCLLAVKYCNPHQLSWTDWESSALTTDLATQSIPSSPQLRKLDSCPDILEMLNVEETLDEAEQPFSICTPLARHQKQALSFMTRRENPNFLVGGEGGLWESRCDGGRNIFINKVSGAVGSEEPPRCCGGVVADPMGLGKTLTMISLIASDLEREAREPEVALSKCTLVVVPLPLLDIWESELRRHVRAGFILWNRHHGKLCLTNSSDLETCHVVLTTYDTVTSEWRRCFSQGLQRPVLFSLLWKRLVLDEAHLIRNPKSQRTKAVCALKATSRWAITGTPIQNNLQDLATFLMFLRVYPYSEPKAFKADITSLWKSGNSEEAVRRLKLLVKCLFLRRPKTVIHLPLRRDLECQLDFRPEERSFYQDFKAKALEHIENALASNHSGSIANASALRRIEALRMICNLGVIYQETSTARNNRWDTIAQDTFDAQRELGVLCCSACDIQLLENEDALDETSYPHHFSRCLRWICSECSGRLITQGQCITCTCGQEISCPVAPVYMDNKSRHILSTKRMPVQTWTQGRLPTKIEALISDIRGLEPGIKCVVFSTWRSTLDLVQAGLERFEIPSIRYDGGVNVHERHLVIERFQNDPSLRVIVLTLSCGAVGLTLTAGRRAYLMEPHWNPTQEDQALARIHRMGQLHEITTIRYYIKGTYEESVINLQKSKRLLADVLLSKDGSSTDKEMLTSFQLLKSII